MLCRRLTDQELSREGAERPVGFNSLLCLNGATGPTAGPTAKVIAREHHDLGFPDREEQAVGESPDHASPRVAMHQRNEERGASQQLHNSPSSTSTARAIACGNSGPSSAPPRPHRPRPPRREGNHDLATHPLRELACSRPGGIWVYLHSPEGAG
jgi:hypothetical protein